jgi:hypothetical protein
MDGNIDYVLGPLSRINSGNTGVQQFGFYWFHDRIEKRGASVKSSAEFGCRFAGQDPLIFCHEFHPVNMWFVQRCYGGRGGIGVDLWRSSLLLCLLCLLFSGGYRGIVSSRDRIAICIKLGWRRRGCGRRCRGRWVMFAVETKLAFLRCKVQLQQQAGRRSRG